VTETSEHKHDWQPLHEGRAFVNIKDGSDTVVYEKCSVCKEERSVKVRRV
jgi:hypothetical protein